MNSMTRYTTEQLQAMPTLTVGQTDDLKVDTGDGTRVWLSRMTRADGAEYDHAVTVERYVSTRWVTVEEYDGDNA